ncbi:ImmA/IrrE family metallo-endopeptidase [Lysobacter sp. FW306-1B-D06B]|uniref:ImmA/IrrE family metallo-endopeptidase n=1 Tax=Lysobacter sp. FW306-1B-D06B TaxID=3140250 RepID=UPI00313FFCC0
MWKDFSIEQVMTPETLLRQLGITSPTQLDLEVIAWHCGLEIQYRPLRGCDARVVGCGDRGLLTIDSRQLEERQRFSIAHELGHWLLHRGQLMMCRSNEIESPSHSAKGFETDADTFAAALLMPAYLFAPAVERVARKEPWAQVRLLSEEFRTSTLATALRMVNLDLWPGWLLSYSKTGRNWYRRSVKAALDTVPCAMLDSRSSAFDIAYGASSAAKPRKVSGDVWFDTYASQRVQLLEHARKYGDDVLALVCATN